MTVNRTAVSARVTTASEIQLIESTKKGNAELSPEQLANLRSIMEGRNALTFVEPREEAALEALRKGRPCSVLYPLQGKLELDIALSPEEETAMREMLQRHSCPPLALHDVFSFSIYTDLPNAEAASDFLRCSAQAYMGLLAEHFSNKKTLPSPDQENFNCFVLPQVLRERKQFLDKLSEMLRADESQIPSSVKHKIRALQKFWLSKNRGAFLIEETVRSFAYCSTSESADTPTMLGKAVAFSNFLVALQTCLSSLAPRLHHNDIIRRYRDALCLINLEDRSPVYEFYQYANKQPLLLKKDLLSNIDPFLRMTKTPINQVPHNPEMWASAYAECYAAQMLHPLFVDLHNFIFQMPLLSTPEEEVPSPQVRLRRIVLNACLLLTNLVPQEQPSRPTPESALTPADLVFFSDLKEASDTLRQILEAHLSSIESSLETLKQTLFALIPSEGTYHFATIREKLEGLDFFVQRLPQLLKRVRKNARKAKETLEKYKPSSRQKQLMQTILLSANDRLIRYVLLLRDTKEALYPGAFRGLSEAEILVPGALLDLICLFPEPGGPSSDAQAAEPDEIETDEKDGQPPPELPLAVAPPPSERMPGPAAAPALAATASHRRRIGRGIFVVPPADTRDRPLPQRGIASAEVQNGMKARKALKVLERMGIYQKQGGRTAGSHRRLVAGNVTVGMTAAHHPSDSIGSGTAAAYRRMSIHR